MIQKIINTIFLVFIVIGAGFSQNSRTAEISQAIVNYLVDTQIDLPSLHADSRYNGLWWSTIENRKSSLYFGKKGKQGRDANCFVSTMISNLLAELYLKNPGDEKIELMIKNSVPAINNFKSAVGYNFFPLMDLPSPLKKRSLESLYPGGIRSASHFEYNNSLVLKAFNINSDADDTALAYYNNYLVNKIWPDFEPALDMLPEDLEALIQIDSDAQAKRNFWNYLRGQRTSTGAYKTWIPDNRDLKKYTFFPRGGQKYIPYGVNDIDCVVNANVLGVLAGMGAKISPDNENAAKWILSQINIPECRKCAVYYPSGNSLYYTVTKACRRGALLLDSTLPIIEMHLLETQKEDGFWTDKLKTNQVQSTLYALGALKYIQQTNPVDSSGVQTAIEKGLDYIYDQLHFEGEKAWLDGGVVFSAGSIFKRKHVWISDAWTTSLLLEILMYYEN